MIIERKTSRRGGTMFVFKFKDEDDQDYWINLWLECADTAHVEMEDYDCNYLKHVVSTLKNRTDDKYATDDYKLSGMLFENEFLTFADETAYLMCVFEHNYIECRDNYIKCRELCDDWEKLYKERKDYYTDLVAEYDKLLCEGHSEKDDEYVNLCLQLGEDFTKLPRAEFIAKYQNEPEEGQTDDEIEIPDDLDWMKEIEVDESALNSTSVDDSKDNLDWMKEIEIHDDSLSD